jgi:hypothetical protein
MVVAHGVVDEVAHGLLDEGHVSLDHQGPFRQAELDEDPRRHRHRTVTFDDALDERSQVDRMALDERFAGLELGRRPEVVDERGQVLGLLESGQEVGLADRPPLGELLA